MVCSFSCFCKTADARTAPRCTDEYMLLRFLNFLAALGTLETIRPAGKPDDAGYTRPGSGSNERDDLRSHVSRFKVGNFETGKFDNRQMTEFDGFLN